MIMMTTVRKYGSFISTAIFLPSLLLFAFEVRAEDLKIGYWHIPPHVTGVENGRPEGAAISYFDRYIAPHLGVTVAWDEKIIPPTRLMDQLRKGRKDAMIFLGHTKERTEYLRYPDPYLKIPQTIAFLDGHPIDRITEVGDLHGLTVGFLVGGRLPEVLQDDSIKYDLIAGEQLLQRNVEKLLIGRIDAIYVPLTIAVENAVRKMGVSDQVKLVPIEFLDPVLIYTPFSKSTVSEAVVDRYNEALARAAKEQPYDDYVKSWRAETGN